MAVPYTFATATASIPLSQLDSNFATGITLGNTTVYLGNTTTSIGNLTLTNATISSVASTFPNSYLANSSVTIGSTSLSLGGTATTITGLTITGSTFSGTSVTDSGLTSGRVTYATTGGLLTDSANFVFDGTNVGIGTTSPSSWGKLAVYGTSSGGQVVSAIVNSSGTANTQAVLSFDTSASGFNVRDSQIRATNNGSNQTTLQFYTANATTPAEAMRIDSSGNVGIGTSSPSGKLNVAGSAATNTNAINLSGTTTAWNRIIFSNTTGGGQIGVEGSTAGSSASGTLAYATVLGDYNNNPLQFITNNTVRATIDSSGNVGIGTSSPAAKLNVTGHLSNIGATFDKGATTQYGINYKNSAQTYTQYVDINNNGTNYWTLYDTTNAQIVTQYVPGASGSNAFYTAGSERMRIDASGNLLVNGTTVRNSAKVSIDYNGSTNGGMGINDTASANGSSLIAFLTGGTFRGGITNNNNTGVLYNVTSDYRLKTVIGSVSDSGQRIDALEPIEYHWNTGGRTRGFLAHKFAEVYPTSVTGEKDAIDENGKPVYQAMQASTPEVMADLIAEIQSLRKRVAIAEEQQALIESLTTRLTALESK
jgi:hypothetical protein